MEVEPSGPRRDPAPRRGGLYLCEWVHRRHAGTSSLPLRDPPHDRCSGKLELEGGLVAAADPMTLVVHPTPAAKRPEHAAVDGRGQMVELRLRGCGDPLELGLLTIGTRVRPVQREDVEVQVNS